MNIYLRKNNIVNPINVFNKIFMCFLFGIIFVMTVLVNVDNVMAENINISFSYGIDNVAKSGTELPIKMEIENKDIRDFVGYIELNVYESNDSVYTYKMDLEIKENEKQNKNTSISISGRQSYIVIDICNDRDEIVATERAIIDLSIYMDKLVIGVVTDDFENITYLENIQVNDNNQRTKIVEIRDDDIVNNRSLLDNIDLLIITGVDLTKRSDTLNFEIENYIKNGKRTIVSLGGINGAYALPNILYKKLMGPTYDTNYFLDGAINVRVTFFEFDGATKLEELDKYICIEKITNDDLNILCLPFCLNDLSKYNNGYSIGKKTIDSIIDYGSENTDIYDVDINNNSASNDYFEIKNLLNLIDKNNLPDTFKIIFILTLYMLFIVIIIYAFLRNINARFLYGICVVICSVIWTILMVQNRFTIIKKNVFMNYISIVDLKENSDKETAFLNIRTNETGNYSFSTDLNNRINPIIEPLTMDMFNIDFINAKIARQTVFEKNDEKKIVTVINAKDFDSNLFSYEKVANVKNAYNINLNVEYFDGKVSGKIINNMDQKLTNVYILLFGKILDVGDIDAKDSVILTKTKKINAPIGNNYMLSHMLSKSDNYRIVEYYLNTNIHKYYDYAYLIGFIDSNSTIDIQSEKIENKFGKTMIVKRTTLKSKVYRNDKCLLENVVVNMEGNYDYNNNTITGENDVINKYSLENYRNIEKIYFEEMDNYEIGNINYTVPFSGEISLYNINTNKYDLLIGKEIDSEKLKNYLDVDNDITIKFAPYKQDPLYRLQSLPILRGIVIND